MAVKMRRTYKSAQRAQQAGATRARIVETAAGLFAAQGFAAVTMERIARDAGVSLATVYLYFPGKAAIVAAMAESVVAAADLSVEHVERETDPIEQLRGGARILRLLNERSWLVADILRGARGSDESLQSVWELWQQRHLAAVRRGIAALDALGALRAGLSVDEAVDTFYALAGTDVYRALVHERGWSPDRYERWLARLGATQLLRTDPVNDPG
jgi:AcrR family transcriptional regulator